MRRACRWLWLLAAVAGSAAHAVPQPWYVSPVPAAETAIRAFDPDHFRHTLYRESHAILIGQVDYKNWEHLDKSRERILELRDALEKHRFKVEVYFDLPADDFASVMENFMRRRATVRDSRIFVYVSGHGFSRLPLDRPIGYLVPVDAPADGGDREALVASSLAMPYFAAWAHLPDPRHMLFVFDACFSGSFFGRPMVGVAPPEGEGRPRLPVRAYKAPPVARGPEVDDYVFQPKTMGKGRQFLTAGSQGEVVPADSKFTTLLIDILNGKRAAEASINFDHWTTATELGTWLEQNTRRLYAGAANPTSPVFGTLRDETYEGGDMIFTRLDIKNEYLIAAERGKDTPLPPEQPIPAVPPPPDPVAPEATPMSGATEIAIQHQINALSSPDTRTRRTARHDLSRILADLPAEQKKRAVERLLRNFSAKSYRFQVGIATAIATQPGTAPAFESETVRSELKQAAVASKDRALTTAINRAIGKVD